MNTKTPLHYNQTESGLCVNIDDLIDIAERTNAIKLIKDFLATTKAFIEKDCIRKQKNDS